MEDLALRERICQGAQQLWLRGLLAGDAGLLTVEAHRRRFLVTPPGKRRSDLLPLDLMNVDLGGVDMNNGPALAPELWRPHRIAYQIDRDSAPGITSTSAPVRATLLAHPPALTALILQQPQTQELLIFGQPGLPILDPTADDPTLLAAIQARRSLYLRNQGLFLAAADLAAALSLAERLEQAALITILSNRRA